MKLKKLLTEAFEGITGVVHTPGAFGKGEGFYSSPKKQLKEVGAAAEYHKLNKQIEKSYRKYWDDVKDFEDVLVKKGLKPAAKQIHKQYAKGVLGFQAWLRKQMDRLL